MSCRCHASDLYASLVDCPKCGHRSFEVLGDWGGCERRKCGYERIDRAEPEQLTLI